MYGVAAKQTLHRRIVTVQIRLQHQAVQVNYLIVENLRTRFIGADHLICVGLNFETDLRCWCKEFNGVNRAGTILAPWEV